MVVCECLLSCDGEEVSALTVWQPLTFLAEKTQIFWPFVTAMNIHFVDFDTFDRCSKTIPNYLLTCCLCNLLIQMCYAFVSGLFIYLDKSQMGDMVKCALSKEV